MTRASGGSTTIWSPQFDARIPLREHEPDGASAGYDFTAIEQPWLREALQVASEDRARDRPVALGDGPHAA